jgi:hypothetical protein
METMSSSQTNTSLKQVTQSSNYKKEKKKVPEVRKVTYVIIFALKGTGLFFSL